jgi:hypothetical protein
MNAYDALRRWFRSSKIVRPDGTHVNVSLSGNLAPIFVRASPAGGSASYSVVMPVRLD